jgi:dihydropteroate synthase
VPEPTTTPSGAPGAAVPPLVARGQTIDLSRPLVMGIVNASPDSFSDGGDHEGVQAQAALAEELLDQGADLLDVGGQSGITKVPEIEIAEELRRVVPLVREIHERRPEAVISVDTYRPEVVEAAIEAGASIVNDVSALVYPEVADLCAATGAALVVMHTRARPKQRLQDPDLYGDDVTGDVVRLVTERLAVARERGVRDESLIVDPGIDFTKTPSQSVAVMRELDQVRAIGLPLLLALSRKDFVGAITMRPPRERLAGTLAAVGHVGAGPGTIFRLHDIAEAVDFLRVLAVLEGRADVDPGLMLPDHLRRQAAGAASTAGTPAP